MFYLIIEVKLGGWAMEIPNFRANNVQKINPGLIWDESFYIELESGR